MPTIMHAVAVMDAATEKEEELATATSTDVVMETEAVMDNSCDTCLVNNYLLIQQATSLFDLLPCRTTELQIAGDWLEDHGLHSFMANVVRQGKWGLLCGIIEHRTTRDHVVFYSYGTGNGPGGGSGSGYGGGCGNGAGGNGHGVGFKRSGDAGYGDGDGKGSGSGDASGDGDTSGRGYGSGSGSGIGYTVGYGSNFHGDRNHPTGNLPFRSSTL